MKSLIFSFLLCLCLAGSLTAGEITVYKTYQDFKDKKGVEYDELFRWGGSEKSGVLVMKHKGEKVDVWTPDIWGFVYQDNFFRITSKEEGYVPVLLISAGKIMYYENGYAHMGMIKYKSKTGSKDGGLNCYVSHDITSEIIGVPLYKAANNYQPLIALADQFPQYKDLLDCMGKGSFVDRIRKCITDFNGK